MLSLKFCALSEAKGMVIKMEISDVKKMQAKKDVEGLIRALKDEDRDVRMLCEIC